MVTTKWWRKEADQIACDLCPRECKMHEGQRGFCFVRQNVGGEMVLTTYGRSTGFCIDPVEKKPLNHFLPGTPILSFGTAGCNLGCKFCQNWDISKSKEIERLSEFASAETIAQSAVSAGCRSVAFTYNDPVIWAEYAIDTAKACHDLGIKTVAVTAGYITKEARGEFYEVMDAANVDLKAFTEEFYYKVTLSHLQPVLDTLRWLKHETDVWFEITNLMIPGENDSESETERMCDWLVENIGQDVPIHFTAFHPDFQMKDKPNTPASTLVRAREIAKNAGIRYPYVGNVFDIANQSTYCHSCGTMVIERNWYELGKYALEGNCCAKCGATIAGVFENRPGNWGRKRVPVRLRDGDMPRMITRQPPNVVQISGAKMSEGKSPEPAKPVRSPANPQPQKVIVPPVVAAPQPNKIPQGAAQQPPAGRSPARVPPQQGRKFPTGAAAVPVNTGMPNPPATAAPAEKTPPKTHFTANEAKQLLSFAVTIVEATALGQPRQVQISKELSGAPAFGSFVTLKRGGQLRACRGQWGGEHKLAELIFNVAKDTTLADPRFPAISPLELPFLSCEISIMHNPRKVVSAGPQRVNEVTIGKHGLVIAHPNGRGLLLPQVATESKWDAPTFLQHLGLKAGLTKDAWLDPNSQLMTFEAVVLHANAKVAELEVASITPRQIRRLAEIAMRAMAGADQPGTGEDPILVQNRVEEIGICLRTPSGSSAAFLGAKKSLAEIARNAGAALKQTIQTQGKQLEAISQIVILSKAIPLRAADYPDRHRGLARSAVVARTNGIFGVVLPAPDGQLDTVQGSLATIRKNTSHWQADTAGDIQLTAFSPHTVSIDVVPDNPNVRKPARAGQFYPASPAEMKTTIEKFLSAGANSKKTNCRAVMLPHAGWVFCGSIIGKTLSRVAKIPDNVIILGPKHTPYGPRWSVAAIKEWQIPGAVVPIAADLRDRLRALVPDLPCEDEAHRVEHGAEVLVPFLHHLNPKVRILPIVQGATDDVAAIPMARALATICREMNPAPLIVISSDMNHYAPEPENRRLDNIAIQAMLSGDPKHLFSTVRSNNISMCGVLPAVTVMQSMLAGGRPPRMELVAYTNSAEASGDASRVVGYCGMLLI